MGGPTTSTMQQRTQSGQLTVDLGITSTTLGLKEIKDAIKEEGNRPLAKSVNAQPNSATTCTIAADIATVVTRHTTKKQNFCVERTQLSVEADKRHILRSLERTIQSLNEKIQDISEDSEQNATPIALRSGAGATVCVIYNHNIYTVQLGHSCAVYGTPHVTLQPILRFNRRHLLGKSDKQKNTTLPSTRTLYGNKFTIQNPEKNENDVEPHFHLYDQGEGQDLTLNVTRSFGNIAFAQSCAVSCTPDTYVHDFSSTPAEKDYLYLHTLGIADDVKPDDLVAACNTAEFVEDITAIYLPLRPLALETDEVMVLGVFNGNGNHGDNISKFLAENFTSEFKKNVELNEDLNFIEREVELAQALLSTNNSPVSSKNARKKNPTINWDKLKEDLENLKIALVKQIQATEEIEKIEIYRHLATNTKKLIDEITNNDNNYQQKMNSILAYREKYTPPPNTSPDATTKSPTQDNNQQETIAYRTMIVVACTVIAAIIGALVGAAIGALVSAELGGIGAIPGAIKGAEYGATGGAVLFGIGSSIYPKWQPNKTNPVIERVKGTFPPLVRKKNFKQDNHKTDAENLVDDATMALRTATYHLPTLSS